jgi:galactitol-specific phosphotransferase system IIB component
MMESYIQMIRHFYPVEEHKFYFLGKCPVSQRNLFKYGNVVELQEGHNKLDKIRNFYKDLSDCDIIIWHGLVLSPKFALFLSFFSKFLDKSVWVMWGIDLYSWKRGTGTRKDGIVNHLNKYIRKNIKYVVAIFPTDIEAYREIFHKKDTDNVFYAPYPMRKSTFYELENINPDLRRRNGEVWIQVGNNANSFNRHLDILEKLKKFSDKNIRIFIPMSYGNDWHNKIDNYKTIVKEKAIEYFGEDRVHVLVNLMSLDEYSRFLQQIDIMIIATDRQNALGNILKCMYSGGKVYLSEKNKLYSYFNDNGINVNRFENIDNEDFDDFARPNQVASLNLKRWMVTNNYVECNIKYWDKLFQQLGFSHNAQTNQQFSSLMTQAEIVNDIKAHAKFREKSNYLNLDLYCAEKASTMQNIRKAQKVVIVGDDNDSTDLLGQIKWENQSRRYIWNVCGIIAEDMFNYGDGAYGCNTIATIEHFEPMEDVQIVNFVKNPQKRECYYRVLEEKGCQFASVKFESTVFLGEAVVDVALWVGMNSLIGNHCKFGKLNRVGNNVIIGDNCVCGDFVTIGDGCFIPAESYIPDYTILPPGTVYDVKRRD